MRAPSSMKSMTTRQKRQSFRLSRSSTPFDDDFDDEVKVERKKSAIIEKNDFFEPHPVKTTVVPSLGQIQRPESMIVPIGGVWRPDDSDVEIPLFDEDEITGTDFDVMITKPLLKSLNN